MNKLSPLQKNHTQLTKPFKNLLYNCLKVFFIMKYHKVINQRLFVQPSLLLR